MRTFCLIWNIFLHANVFYALQAPVYYYVKTKGSLASQGLSITKTVKMKFMVFEYYNEFYKNVYDEKAYEKKRLSVYRFFLDAASDGTVPPTLLPGAKSSAQSASRSVLPRSPERVSYRSSTGAASFWTAVWRRSPCAMI